MKKSTINLAIAITLIAIGITLRLVPHPANFAPITAIALFGGAILPRRYGIWVPLAAMMLSDSIIGFHNLILVTWGCFGLIALASSYWLKKSTLLKGLSLTIGSSLFFFVVTNFAVWVKSGMYAHSWSGLVLCYQMALPFFRNTFASDLVYTSAFFGVYFLASKYAHRLSTDISAPIKS